jgi:hypothetical protein
MGIHKKLLQSQDERLSRPRKSESTKDFAIGSKYDKLVTSTAPSWIDSGPSCRPWTRTTGRGEEQRSAAENTL